MPASSDSSMASTATTAVSPEKHRPRRCALPAWLDHFNRSDLKVMSRCWAAVWAAMLLVFINPVLQAMGSATFVASLVLFIAPPAGILMVYLMGSLSLLLGMCLAWTWGLVVMKAALAVRSDDDVQRLLRSLEEEAVAIAGRTGQPAAEAATELVYNGFFLDTRVTVVYYVMCSVFIYALARVRHANAKLMLLQIFGTMVIDLFLLFGPLLVRFDGGLGGALVKPAAAGTALGIACSVLVFPRSTSYVLLAQMETLVRLLDAPLEATRRMFAVETASSEAELRASRDTIVGAFRATEPAVAVLSLDASRGMWSADDVKRLHGRLREAVTAGLFLLDFQIGRVSAAELGPSVVTKTADSTAPRPRAATTTTPDHQQEVHQDGGEKNTDTTTNGGGFASDVIDAMRRPEHSRVRSGLLEALRATTAEVLQVNSQAVGLVAEVMRVVNTSRWHQSVSAEARLERLPSELKGTRARLRAAREACVAGTNDAIVGAHADLFDDRGLLKVRSTSTSHPLALNGLIVSMVLEERIVNAAEATEKLLHHVAQLLESRNRRRIWLPVRLHHAFSWLANRDLPTPILGSSGDVSVDPDDIQAQREDTHRRLRMVIEGNRGAGAHRNRGVVTRAVVSVSKWLFNPGGIYALRMVVVTVAVAVPACIPATAGFVYRQKSIWAVIMAQLCMLMYMADFTFALVSRSAGTVVGGVLGMAAWYAGCGSGEGNPYGLAATTAVVSAVTVWWRLYLPPVFTLASIMTGATFALVVGFSWDEHHIEQYGLPGVGYEAFWKRVVLVFVGLGTGLIVQMFPTPPSATRHISKSLANHVRSLNDHHALLISQWDWGQPERRIRKNAGAAAAAAAEQISLRLAEQLASLTSPIYLLKVEFSTTPFDRAILLSVRDRCDVMNQCLGKLLILSANLPRHLQNRLGQNAGFGTDKSVAKITSVLSIVESALRTGDPLPERLPVPLVESCFVEWYGHHERAELAVGLVRTSEYRQYCVAVSAYLSFLATVDDLVAELKATLGETHIVRRWDDDEGF